MTGTRRSGGRRVVVVTGGGGGIGAAVAEELGRRGDHVVTMDPLVTLDGAERLPPPEETTAGRIVAAGGSAQASTASVTEGDAVRALFAELVTEHGRLDAVVNVAGISRPTSFESGREEDWRDVLAVHLGGYLHVLDAALPLMAAAGHGRVLGVTSGSGWRAADAGAYGCAKRAVAALTWQVGRRPPPGVVVNAISPIAVTRMVTAALERASGGRRPGAAATGGLSLGSMPQPGDLGPLAAHLVGEELSWCSGRVVFAGGPEVALVDRPRLLEVVRTEGMTSLPHALEAVTPGALVPAEAAQTSTGGSNPRFPSLLEAPPAEAALPQAPPGPVALVTDRPELRQAVTAALAARGMATLLVEPGPGAPGFAPRAEALAAATERAGPLSGVVVALAGRAPAPSALSDWERILAEHRGLDEDLCIDAAWVRAVADHAAATGRPLRLVTLTDAVSAGGRSRAQASAQLARASRRATEDRVAAFAVSVEVREAEAAGPAGELTAHLLGSPAAEGLAGAELVMSRGWFGLRSHPRPGTSVALGTPQLPEWFDGLFAELVGGPDEEDR